MRKRWEKRFLDDVPTLLVDMKTLTPTRHRTP